jgi:hypothetical protein
MVDLPTHFNETVQENSVVVGIQKTLFNSKTFKGSDTIIA